MTTSATEAVTTPPVTNGLSASVPTASSKDKDMFLQLLVAQMKYQDPTNPTDSAQFLAQSAQFTALEKMQSVADQTGLLLGAQLAFGASSLVGRSVTYTGEDGAEVTGTVSGVHFGVEGPVLDVAGQQVPIGAVLTVTDPSSAATAPPA